MYKHVHQDQRKLLFTHNYIVSFTFKVSHKLTPTPMGPAGEMDGPDSLCTRIHKRACFSRKKIQWAMGAARGACAPQPDRRHVHSPLIEWQPWTTARRAPNQQTTARLHIGLASSFPSQSSSDAAVAVPACAAYDLAIRICTDENGSSVICQGTCYLTLAVSCTWACAFF
jgi:hypothetical protein